MTNIFITEKLAIEIKAQTSDLKNGKKNILVQKDKAAKFLAY